MRARMVPLLLAVIMSAGTLYPALRPAYPLIVYNPSPSVPRGWYAIREHSDYHVGSIVLVHLPPPFAELAAQRGYLSRNTPLLKRVAALAPQVVCMRNRSVTIDDSPVAIPRVEDVQHRPMPMASFCGALDVQQVFLLSSDHPDSFDGRYFGPVDRRQVIGIAEPMWTP